MSERKRIERKVESAIDSATDLKMMFEVFKRSALVFDSHIPIDSLRRAFMAGAASLLDLMIRPPAEGEKMDPAARLELLHTEVGEFAQEMAQLALRLQMERRQQATGETH